MQDTRLKTNFSKSLNEKIFSFFHKTGYFGEILALVWLLERLKSIASVFPVLFPPDGSAGVPRKLNFGFIKRQ